jgi:HAD superfamily hydrolase (TIGR01509 family)
MFENIKGVIFDCDGVLFESRRANLAYYNAILSQFGHPLVDENDTEKTAICHAAASPEVFRFLLGEDRVAEALQLSSQLHYQQFIPWMEPEPGLLEVLQELSASRPLAVATNRGTSMDEILRHFQIDRFFKAVVTSRDVSRPKPHADMLLLAAERLALPLDQLLFVGDSIYDKMAAESAGIRFAAYKPQFEQEPYLTSHAELAGLLRSVR